MSSLSVPMRPIAPANALNRDIASVSTQETQDLFRRFSELRIAKSPSQVNATVVDAPEVVGQLEQTIFDALAQVKIYASQVAMHLDRKWRDRLFRKLNLLHDVDEWQSGDCPVLFDSFEAFIRTIIDLRPIKDPSIGLSAGGHIVAVWISGEDRLTLEFMERHVVRVVLAIRIDEEPERAALETQIARLRAVLSPYSPDRWFKA